MTKLKERDPVSGKTTELRVVFCEKDRALVPVSHIWKISRVMTLFMVGQFNVFQMATEPCFIHSLSIVVWRLQQHKWWEHKIQEWLQANILLMCARFVRTNGGMANLIQIAMEIYMRGVSDLLEAGEEYVNALINLEAESGHAERLLAYFQSNYSVKSRHAKKAWKSILESGNRWPDLDDHTSKMMKEPPLPILQEIMKAEAKRKAMESHAKAMKRKRVR